MDNQNNNLANNQPGSESAVSKGQSATPAPPAVQSTAETPSTLPVQPPAQPPVPPPSAENEADKVNVVIPEKPNSVPN